jgi:predicted secreted hydrolase
MKYVVMAILSFVFSVLLIRSCADDQKPLDPSGSDLTMLLRGADPSQFPAQFPSVLPDQIGTPLQELAARPKQRMEWWYFTGNLQSTSGRQFGYQLTIFRFAIQPGQHALMGHYAISDLDLKRFYAQERFAHWDQRLGRIESSPLRLELDHWQINQTAADQFDFALVASNTEAPATSLQLKLSATAPAIAQGVAGFSQKSSLANNASMYFSVPRLATSGEIIVEGQRHQVSGLSWLDREASSSQLGSQQTGWRWFALHLDDGTDLMVYGLVNQLGGFDQFSSGSLRRAARTGADTRAPIILQANDFVLKPMRIATMADGQRFATEWSINIAKHQIAITVQAAFDQQYWQGASFPYWEGAVRVSGSHIGTGYLEMTGGER